MLQSNTLSNRYVEELSIVYACLLRDAGVAYPTLVEEFERDLTRLQLAIKRRGLPTFFVDLPAVGKHFDRCLADGEYKLSGLPLTGRYSNRVVIPKLFRGLYLLVFNDQGHLRKDASYEAIFFLRQICFGAKKSDFACDVCAIENEVFDFAAIDGELPKPERFWQATSPKPQDIDRTYAGFGVSDQYFCRLGGMDVSDLVRNTIATFLMNMDKVSNIISSTLGPYDPSEWKFRHGPGAISEKTGPTNKFYWTNWSDRLECVFPIADYGFHNLTSWAGAAKDVESGTRTLLGQDPSSRLVAVPKTFTKPRLIAAEPSEHQWCQQNLWAYFDERVSRTWLSSFVSFSDQKRNQDLCTRGSKDGSLATVDLSAASDRVTCHAVGQMFRGNPKLLLALRATRTRFVRQNLVKSLPGLIELKKFSTMGSACTFPVESLIFLSIILAAVLTVRKQRVTLSAIRALSGEVSAYGDDLIIPVDSRELVFSGLEVLHFKVNSAKSYWTGKFRESCGVDSYDGVNVTPAFWKSPYTGKPESLVSTIAVRNNFYQKFLLHTAKYLTSTVRGVAIPYVAIDSGVCGFKSRVGPIVPGVKSRYNGSLQRMESLVPLLIAKVARTPITDDSALLQYFTERPDPLIKWKHGVSQRPRLIVKSSWVPSSDIIAQ